MAKSISNFKAPHARLLKIMNMICCGDLCSLFFLSLRPHKCLENFSPTVDKSRDKKDQAQGVSLLKCPSIVKKNKLTRLSSSDEK